MKHTTRLQENITGVPSGIELDTALAARGGLETQNLSVGDRFQLGGLASSNGRRQCFGTYPARQRTVIAGERLGVTAVVLARREWLRNG